MLEAKTDGIHTQINRRIESKRSNASLPPSLPPVSHKLVQLQCSAAQCMQYIRSGVSFASQAGKGKGIISSSRKKSGVVSQHTTHSPCKPLQDLQA
jgi:hypothetical protein